MNTETNNQAPYVEPINLTPVYPMKWYKFLIYFSLFFSAVLNGISGIRYLNGSIYGSDVDVDYIYSFFDGLKTLDVAMGIACIVIAIFAIYTRSRLANYKKDGPKCLYIIYIVGAIISLVYVIIGQAILGVETSIPSETVGSIISSGVIVFCNYKYFEKRKSLFVND